MGSMKMTPMEALEVALCQAPLDLAAIEAAGQTVYRMSGRMEEYIYIYILKTIRRTIINFQENLHTECLLL